VTRRCTPTIDGDSFEGGRRVGTREMTDDEIARIRRGIHDAKISIARWILSTASLFIASVLAATQLNSPWDIITCVLLLAAMTVFVVGGLGAAWEHIPVLRRGRDVAAGTVLQYAYAPYGQETDKLIELLPVTPTVWDVPDSYFDDDAPDGINLSGRE
jgi:hypothetical protein